MIDEDSLNMIRCETPAGTVFRPRAAAARRGLALCVGTGKGINPSSGLGLLVPETIRRPFILNIFLVARHRELLPVSGDGSRQSTDLVAVSIVVLLSPIFQASLLWAEIFGAAKPYR